MSLFIYLLLTSIFLIDVVLFSYDKYEWSVTVMIASLIGAYFVMPQLSTFVQTSWLTILTTYLPLYLVAGLVVAVVKWVLYNVKYVGKIRELKTKFNINNPEGQDVKLKSDERKATPSTDPKVLATRRREAFVEYVKQTTSYDRPAIFHEVNFASETSVVDALTPRAKDNIGCITIWILQWPVVVVSTLISDLLVKIGKHTARLFDWMFSVISRKLVANATKGL